MTLIELIDNQAMTLIELVNHRLHQMFIQLAEDIAAGEIGNLTPGEAAAVPLALFSAEEAMRRAFKRLVTSGETPEP